jgi:branched-chain amino acid transport system substrate-binding protein
MNITAFRSPIRIGYCLSLTGPVAGNSRSARLAQDIWAEDIAAACRLHTPHWRAW